MLFARRPEIFHFVAVLIRAAQGVGLCSPTLSLFVSLFLSSFLVATDKKENNSSAAFYEQLDAITLRFYCSCSSDFKKKSNYALELGKRAKISFLKRALKASESRDRLLAGN